MITIDTIQLPPFEEPDARLQRSGFAPRLVFDVVSVFVRLWRFYCALAAKKRSRLALDELSDKQLKDIGISKAEARREAAVPFWR